MTQAKVADQQVPLRQRMVLLTTDSGHSIIGEVVGGKTNALAYSAYGEQSAQQEIETRLGFNGQLREQSIGWYLLGNGYRAYNPRLMRFHSPDSWSPFSGGGLNAYMYCVGDPVNRSDPTGHISMISFLILEVAEKLDKLQVTWPGTKPEARRSIYKPVARFLAYFEDNKLSRGNRRPSSDGSFEVVLNALNIIEKNNKQPKMKIIDSTGPWNAPTEPWHNNHSDYYPGGLVPNNQNLTIHLHRLKHWLIEPEVHSQVQMQTPLILQTLARRIRKPRKLNQLTPHTNLVWLVKIIRPRTVLR